MWLGAMERSDGRTGEPIMISERKFWMVLGEGPPTYRHYTQHQACIEAERLAKLHPHQTFTVMESVASVVRQNVLWARHDSDASDDNLFDIPF